MATPEILFWLTTAAYAVVIACVIMARLYKSGYILRHGNEHGKWRRHGNGWRRERSEE